MPAQCTLWDNVLIGRDPQTAEVMLSLLRKAREKGDEWRVGGWLRPGKLVKKRKMYTNIGAKTHKFVENLIITNKKNVFASLAQNQLTWMQYD